MTGFLADARTLKASVNIRHNATDMAFRAPTSEHAYVALRQSISMSLQTFRHFGTDCQSGHVDSICERICSAHTMQSMKLSTGSLSYSLQSMVQRPPTLGLCLLKLPALLAAIQIRFGSQPCSHDRQMLACCCSMYSSDLD